MGNTIECDDGNLIKGDGCNTKCVIEKDWSCEGGNSKQTDFCRDTSETTFKIESIPNQNYEFKLVFSKQLDDYTSKNIDKIMDVSMTKINKTEFNYILETLEKVGKQ